MVDTEASGDTGKLQEEFTVKIVTEWPTDQLVRLYKSGKWWRDEYDESGLPALVRGSLAFAVCVGADGMAVGMGRAISDGVSDAYIQDMVVLDELRGHGLGARMLTVLRDRCLELGVSWIALVAEPGTEAFYTRHGFRPMAGHVPMRYMSN